MIITNSYEICSSDINSPKDIAEMKAVLLESLTHMSFVPDLEEKLVDQFVDFLAGNKKMFGKPTSVKREVGTGHSIADVVAYFAPQKKSSKFLQASLSTFDSVVLSLIRRANEISLEQLLHLNISTEEKIIKSVERLSNKDLVVLKKNKIISTNYNTTKVIAFEAKLRDWKKALSQAESYLNYADESYVVLPSGKAKSAVQSIEAFVESGIGLIIVDNSTAKILLKGKKSASHDWRREFVITRAFEAVL